MRRIAVAATLVALCALAAVQPATAATRLTIRGAGFGHGIGMSQFGAYGFALHLKDYRFILRHYYTGTELARLAGGREVRVLLQDARRSIEVTGALRAGDQALDPAKTYTLRRGGSGLLLRDGSEDVLTSAGPMRLDAPVGQALTLNGTSAPGLRNGRYRGGIIVSASGATRLRAVNAVALEDYVRGVVSAESPASWPAEALRAQAVAARTYAITTGGGASFDQYADTRSQVYRGVAGETPTTDAAVAATAGEVVTYGGQPAVTFFFSTSGGETEDIENSFIGATPRPWLKSVEDPFDDLSPKHRWTPLRFSELQARVRLRPYVRGRFKRIKVIERGSSPRVVRARVIGTRGIVEVTGPQLRAALGLSDTWAFFTSITTTAKKLNTAKPPTTAPTTTQTTPISAGDPTGGAIAAAARARAASALISGTIDTGRRGALVRVQRRHGDRWVAAGTTRIRAGGRYGARVRGAGSYRVVYGAAIGPTVDVR